MHGALLLIYTFEADFEIAVELIPILKAPSSPSTGLSEAKRNPNLHSKANFLFHAKNKAQIRASSALRGTHGGDCVPPQHCKSLSPGVFKSLWMPTVLQSLWCCWDTQN